MTVKYNGYSLNDLKQTVLKFEAEELDLTDVSWALVGEFGYACLANSLLFKEPKIPEYNAEEINEYIQTNVFTTIESLADYINSLDNDINKLFAIFSYAANYIKYDTQSSFSDNVPENTLEEIFEKSCAVSTGYVAFFLRMAEMVNLDTERINMKEYSNYGKGYEYDPTNPPKEAKPNHYSIYITIDGVPFISEPTWAAGYVSNNKFVADYNPHLFLIPFLKSLCDHYPCGESQSLLPFEFPFEDFLKACALRPFGKNLKTEAIPYINFECKNGFLEQIYSCTYPINNISMNLYRKNSKRFTKISSEGITSYEIIQPKILDRPDRCRFRTNIAFPKKGFYKVELIIDSKNAHTYYIDSPVQSTISVPITFNPFHESKFIPIIPKRTLNAVRHGVALIRFAVESEHSTLLWDIKKLTDQNSFDDEDSEVINREYGRYVKLTIPFDDIRYEDQLCVTFPSNGRYAVVIYLSNDIGSYENYTKYFFDVTGVPEEKQIPVNPVNFMFNGRIFAPLKILDGDENEVIIEPNQNCYLVDQSEQKIRIKTFVADDDIHLEFKHEEEAVAIPEMAGTEGDFRTFKWSIPKDFGEYHLVGWINDKCCLNLTYIYRNGFLREPSENEKALLNELKSKIDLDESKVEMKRELKSKRAEECEGKTQSKCCLLI